MCASTTGNIFTVPTAVADIVSNTATYAQYLSSYHSLSLSILYTLSLHLSFLNLSFHVSSLHLSLPPSAWYSIRIVIHLSSLLIVTPRFTPYVVSSSPLMCWFLVRGLSTHYFSSQSGMTWSSHINLIGKLEKRSCYKHSREDTNDFGAQTV